MQTPGDIWNLEKKLNEDLIYWVEKTVLRNQLGILPSAL